MFPVFALIFLLVPLVEIYILIQVGQVIGALWTVFFVVLTAVIGVALLKQQGLSTLTRAQEKMNHGEVPANELLEGLALLVAGAFLLTPGFFTDAFGFVLLFPPTRSALITAMQKRFVAAGRFSVEGAYRSGSKQDSQQGNIIEGVNYHEDKDERQ